MNQRTILLTLVIACAGVAVAWQTALSAVGWSEQHAAQIAESFFLNRSSALPNNGSISPSVKARWSGRSPAERAQAIRELSLYAKKYVQTPAFEKMYEGWIKQRYNAFNHGIKIDANAAASEPDAGAALSMAVRDMAKAFEQFDANMLRMLLTQDTQSLRNARSESDKKMLARYQQIESLLNTNPPEARKQYAMAKAMQMGGGGDEAQVHAKLAAGEKRAAELKRQSEQRAWDEHNLKSELRRRLSEFVKTAESVDFAAQTQRNAGKLVFADPVHERKPHHWKLLYRLGKEPTMAAADVARQWLREL